MYKQEVPLPNIFQYSTVIWWKTVYMQHVIQKNKEKQQCFETVIKTLIYSGTRWYPNNNLFTTQRLQDVTWNKPITIYKLQTDAYNSDDGIIQGDWYLHPELFAQENPGTTLKIKQKRSEKFKLCIHNVVVLRNIAFYMCLTLRIMVKCTGATFVCKWIESIG